jgi:hypothetical protein
MTEVLSVEGDTMTIRISIFRSDDGIISRDDRTTTVLTGKSWETESHEIHELLCQRLVEQQLGPE